MKEEIEMPKNVYNDPFTERYASGEMLYVFSPLMKFRTWRDLWIAMAQAQKELGLPITDDQIKEMKSKRDDVNFEDARKKEEETKHDVMAHIHAFGLQCPKAKPIIHLGATSAYVGDNTEIIQMKEGLKIVRTKLINVIDNLCRFADRYKSLATLSYTHLQPSQPTTVGKRACLWLGDLVEDFKRLEFEFEDMKFLGVKGTTGTQDSYMKLFDGDSKKVKALDDKVAGKMGFEKIYEVTGQTYPRKLDALIVGVLSGIAQSAHKFANDLRMLQHLREIQEPFGKGQVGSSAMAYKKNPIKSERMTALARLVMNFQSIALTNAGSQYFERTLDDSANRRIVIPTAFLAIDGILNLYHHIVTGMSLNEKIVEANLKKELPFMATEEILMMASKAGGDRQKLHEKIRKHSMEVRDGMYNDGKENDLIERLKNDPDFKAVDFSKNLLKPERFTGRSKEQTEEFLDQRVKPLLKKYKSELGRGFEVKV